MRKRYGRGAFFDKIDNELSIRNIVRRLLKPPQLPVEKTSRKCPHCKFMSGPNKKRCVECDSLFPAI